jgi:hypothetical protein
MKKMLVLLVSAVVLAVPVVAQQQENALATANPLVQLLQSKGILTADEAATVNRASSADEANARLAQLLREKGLITDQEYRTTVTPSVVPVNNDASSPAQVVNAVLRTSDATASPVQGSQATSGAPASSEPPVVPAVAPLRVLPIDAPKQGGIIPDISLGSGAKMKLYGFFKSTAIVDTTSSGGANFGSQDWPLPLLLGDTGPTADPQFHLKARSFRVGSQFEWVPKQSNMTITGKVEADYEGDYTQVNNRNISSVRSSQFSLRLAYMRLDTKLGGTVPWFAEFGQDWALVSSTLPSLFETTGLGIAMGTLYERIPQFRTGVQFGAGSLKIQPEFAIVLPAAGSSALTADERARFGDRAGSESNRPGEEARVVLQFPLSHSWKGVVPAQFIVSGHHARMNEVIPAANLPATLVAGAAGCSAPLTTGGCSIKSFFPRGVTASNVQNVWTGEVQLPTPWVTFVGKYYRGNDLRFFFAGQVNDVFSNLGLATNVGEALSFSNRVITFGCLGATTLPTTPPTLVSCNGNPINIARLQPIGGQGGFAELSFPLSRIFHANPEGHNSGWVFHVQYGTDRAYAADVVHGNDLVRTDLDTASITYRLNKWITFVNEASYIQTRVAKPSATVLFRGTPATQAHDWRNEVGPVFTF